MEKLLTEALRTQTIDSGDASSLLPDDACLILAGGPADDRGGRTAWGEFCQRSPDHVVEVSLVGPETITLERNGAAAEHKLRSSHEVFASLPSTNCYIDISGLPFQVWAPLIRAGVDCTPELVVAYSEPAHYKWHPTPTSEAFDLSSRIGGIRPLPGFAKLGPETKDQLLIVFLGFEGARARHIASVFDPLPRTVSVVGSPGYGHDFSQHALTTNIEFLHQTDSLSDIRLAASSSPYEAVHVIEDAVRAHHPEHTVIAPLGTKPHALGCLLYCLDHWDSAELLFDHPTPRVGWSTGMQRVNLYTLKP